MQIVNANYQYMRKCLLLILASLMLASCGEYQRAQKSTDYDYKLDFARRAFEQKRYVQAATILTDIITVFKGTDKAEESLYLLALSHYENKDYINSGNYFKTYYNRYPRGKYTELARFYAGYGLIRQIRSSISREQSKRSRNFKDFSTSFPAATR